MLDKQFNLVQTRINATQYWSDKDFAPHGNGAPFCIMLPPPNVTGTLHMGHGFQHTLMDALIRYHRMLGDKTLWQPGTDHAGIATQIVVERQLTKAGLERKSIGRENFEQRVWQWKEQSGNTIIQQMKKLGTTCDWSRLRFTMDEGLSKAVATAFVKLYDEGLIYRGTRLVNWDPVLQTALSDLEVLSEEEKGSLWHIRYPIVDVTFSLKYLTVATTRPETLLGDVAIAVNPEDERYQHLIGKKVHLPLTSREIAIIVDEYVDPAFGTGCVKITPAHDFNDFEVGKRHQLPSINIFTKDAKLNDQVPEAYRDLTREAARKKIVEDLAAQGLIEKIEPHTLQVPRSEKSGAVVEPYLTEQWYVQMEPLAKPALEAVEAGKIQFVPENWINTYRQWLTNIQDWCISRQLWWGHRIPAWYDEEGKVYVAHDEKEAQAKAGTKKLHQDEDVLDTWFSSALWPFSTLGWPGETEALKDFYPTNVLVTGFDIIFFWVARMIMFGLYFTKQIPFKQVLFTGLIRDHDGQKMSKSKGNVLDPIDLIDGISLEDLIKKRTSGLMLESQAKTIESATRRQFPQGISAFGEDALRFTYCALATHGRDVRFDLARIEGYRNFCNKIWNATRFIQMQLENAGLTHLPQGFPSFSTCEPFEQYILKKLNETIMQTKKHYEAYRFDLLAQTLYEFVWYEFCDWYIEFSKSHSTEQTLRILVNVLEYILRLLHPLIPFITEDLWQNALKPILRLQGKALMLTSYPEEIYVEGSDRTSLAEANKIISSEARNLRKNFPLVEGDLLLKDPAQELKDSLDIPSLKEFAKKLSKVSNIKVAEAHQDFSVGYAISATASATFIMKLAFDENFEAEKKARKEKEQKEKLKLEAEKINLETRLAKADKVPKEVVEKWQVRVKEIIEGLKKLN